MKVLLIQENGRHDANKQYRECLSLQKAFISMGWVADVWGLNHESWPTFPSFNEYDVIFNLENHDDIGWVPDFSKITKPFKILWAIDAHSRSIYPYEYEFKRGKYNLLLHSTLDYVDNKNRIWFPNTFDNTLIFPLNKEKTYDVGFCGDRSNRGDYIDLLQDQKEFTFKSDIFVIGDAMVEAINSYNIHFNKNWGNDINYRSFETIACKTPLFTNYNYQYDLLGFKDNINCVFYKSKEDLIDKIKYYLNNKDKLSIIGENGFILSKKHNYNERVKNLLMFLKNQKGYI